MMASEICATDGLVVGRAELHSSVSGGRWTTGVMPDEIDNTVRVEGRSGPLVSAMAPSWKRKQRRYKRAFFAGLSCANGPHGLITHRKALAITNADTCAQNDGNCDVSLSKVTINWPFTFGEGTGSILALAPRRALRDPQSAETLQFILFATSKVMRRRT